MYTYRKKLKQDFFQFRRVYGPSVCRKTDKKAGGNPFGCDFAGSPLQNLLSAVADRDKSAFSGSFCTEGVMVYLLFELAGKIVAECDLIYLFFVVGGGKACVFVKDLYTYVRRRGEGISLYMINGEDITVELVGAFQGFVGGVALSMNGAKGGLQLG